MCDSPLNPVAASGDRDAELEAMRAEYARAIELINLVRAGTSHPGLDAVRHWALPASKISADFFCTAEHAQNGWFALLADAAGHGLASAIFALQTPMLFRESVMRGLSLAAIHARIDQLLQRQHVFGYFVCGLLVHVDGREIEIINAGMPDALLLGPDGSVLHAFPSTNVPFGIAKERAALSRRYRLARNETASLLIYSDGLSELGEAGGDALGADGVRALAAAGGTAGLFERLVARAEAGSHRAHDDISIVEIPVPLPTGAAALEDEEADAAGLSAGEMDQLANLVAALRIVEHLDRGLVFTDAEQNILYVNPAFTAATGYTLPEVIGRTPRLLSSGRHPPEFYQAMWRTLLDEGTWSGEIWNRRKDGSLYLEWLELRALRDGDGVITNFLATFTVLSLHHEQQERLRQLALHDALTGLANRILLADRGAQAMHRADRADASLAVLFIDLDRFKSINDSLGHDIGDQVLVAVSQRLAGALREGDTLARIGGNEFVALLPDIARRDDATLVAAKLLDALAQPIEVAGHRFKVGASIGVAAYPSDARVFDDLLVFAEHAMRRAKQAGGNIVRFFSSDIAVSAARQLEMEVRLDAAIRNGELELHFQPKIDLKQRRVVGAEALVRWRDPQQGLVPPGMFIPVAEKSDLIAKIGSWVLREACAAVARWEAFLPEEFHVAVNVSPLQLERCDIGSEVEAAIADSRIAPARLQLEVTESLFIRDPEAAARLLDGVVAQGVAIALDDFGTGYSNLGALIKLPLDTFKLDQSFVREVDSRPAHGSVAKAVWHLADGLRKEVVAEGIETCGECLMMQKLGYRVGQGYRFGKPMAEEGFIDYLKRRQTCDCLCPSHFAD